MTGLVGFVSTKETSHLIRNSSELLSKMCQAVKHETWHKIDTYLNKTVGLGRVHLGIFNPELQPIYNKDKTLCMMMDGEIYDYQDLKSELVSRGYNFSINNDPEFILSLYEEYGKDFVHKLNGSFTLVIWNEKSKELLIINDRYGLRPLYYSLSDGCLLFGSEVKAILQDETFKKIVDDRSVADFFSFGYILGNKTFFKEIEVLPPASIMTFDRGHASIGQYWDFDFIENNENHPEQYYIEKISNLLLQAVERQMKGSHRIGVPLSGGLDSRTIVASIQEKHYPLHTFTFGKPNCDDVKFAQMVSRTLGAIHHFFDFKPDDLTLYAEKSVNITDGMLNCIHAHRMQTYSEIRNLMNVVLGGYMGDAIMGNFLIENPDENIDDFQIFKLLSDYISVDLLKDLFNDEYFPIFNKNLNSSKDYIVQMGKNIDTKSINNRLMYYNFRERQRRFILMGPILTRNSLEMRTPFLDNDLIDFILTVPTIYMINKHLYKKMILTIFLQLADIPYQATGLPLHASKFKVNTYFLLFKKMAYKINRTIFKFEFLIDPKGYADYNEWMRKNRNLREYIINILLDKKTLERPYFDQKHIQKILDAHMSGEKNYSELIGRLLTFELWNREFID